MLSHNQMMINNPVNNILTQRIQKITEILTNQDKTKNQFSNTTIAIKKPNTSIDCILMSMC